MRVKKVFNNSVVLGIDEHGTESVLLGAGLGFSLSPGMEVDPAKVERTFVPGGGTNAERLAAFVQEIPIEDIDITEEILRNAGQELGPHVTDHMLVPLADHISFALRRAREGVAEIDYPLRWEVQQLYPAEVRFGTAALKVIEERTGVKLPAVEAVPLALHFVNAQFGAPDLTTAMRMTAVLTEILTLIRARIGLEIDENSVAVGRLVTHLRYLFLREHRGEMIKDDGRNLFAAVQNALPLEYRCALEIGQLLAERFGQPITPDEVMYLTLHVGRLTASVRPPNESSSEDARE